MAYAGALFADSCLRGLNGNPTVECTYVESTVTDSPYFASKVKLSTEGEWSGVCTTHPPTEGEGPGRHSCVHAWMHASMLGQG